MTAKAHKRPPIERCPTCSQAQLRRHCPEPSESAKQGSSTCDWVRCANCKAVGLADGSRWLGRTPA